MGLSLGIGLGLGFARSKSGGWSLTSLFSNGEDGFLFFPALAENLFQDAAATMAVAANDDPVGRFNDQSGNGRNAVNATGAQRPLWKANSGKPYINNDGSDDRLVSPFVPTAAVTLACAIRPNSTPGVAQLAMGGGASSGNKRCFVGLSAGGSACLGWGSESLVAYGAAISGADHVLLLTGDGVSRDLWLDGVLLNSSAPAGGTGPDGTGGGVSVGAYNNNVSTGNNPLSGRFWAGVGVNRRVTVAEIAHITSQLRSAYQ